MALRRNLVKLHLTITPQQVQWPPHLWVSRKTSILISNANTVTKYVTIHLQPVLISAKNVQHTRHTGDPNLEPCSPHPHAVSSLYSISAATLCKQRFLLQPPRQIATHARAAAKVVHNPDGVFCIPSGGFRGGRRGHVPPPPSKSPIFLCVMSRPWPCMLQTCRLVVASLVCMR